MYELSFEMPGRIADRIADHYGDLMTMASALKMEYTTLRSVLATGGSRAADTLSALAQPIGADVGKLGEILSMPSSEARKEKVAALLQGMSYTEWADAAGRSRESISMLVNADENLQIKNLCQVAEGLEMDLSTFVQEYRVVRVQPDVN